jgi:hypothetical protein
MMRWWNWRGVSHVAVLSLVLLMLVPTWSSAETSVESLEAFGLYVFRSGIRAPEFTTTDLQGNQVRLEAYRGKVILLVFWATW